MEPGEGGRRDYMRQYIAANKTKITDQRRIAARRRYAADPDKHRATQRLKYEAEKQRYLTASARWKDENKAVLAERRREEYLRRKLEQRAWSALVGARNRARNKGLEFDLTKDWLASRSTVCELSGLKFRPEYDGVHDRNPFAPSIDRISSSGGYTQGNCRVILCCLNMGLGQWGLDEVLPAWQAIIKRRERT